MKKIFAMFLLVTLFAANALFCAHAASAEEASSVSWARVEKDGINLYATEYSSKVICLLEKSYYLKILETRSEMLLVAVMENKADFPQITGYVWKSEVKLSSEEPLSPAYPTVKITVSGDSAGLKLSPTPSAETVIVATNTQTLSYYGEIESYGRKWYYVYYGGRFGYVETDSVTVPQVPPHPTPLVTETIKPVLPSEDDQNGAENENPPQKSNSPAAEILLAVFVVVLAVGLTLALFLPGNTKKKNVFEQDI